MSLALLGATISYEGVEQRVDPGLVDLPGVIMLDIEQTALLTGGPVPGHRHFVACFNWICQWGAVAA